MNKRTIKWKAKLSGDNRKLLYDAQKERMVRLEAEATKELTKREIEVKQLAGTEPNLLQYYYIIFAKELYRIEKLFKSNTLYNEATILEEKWKARGLNDIILERIKEFYIEGYKVRVCFRLDISELDGDHRLC